MLTFLLYCIHILVCVILILVVLLQSGKAADLAGAFGGGGSQTALGSRGAVTLLAKATTICAVLFMLTSLGLALLGSRGGGSVLDSATIEEPAAGTAVPAAPAEDGTAPAAIPPGDQAAPAGQPPAETGGDK